MSDAILGLTGDPRWVLRVAGFEPLRERGVETLLTIANGYAGTRGALEEGSEASSPSTVLAGVFEPARENPEPPKDLAESPALVGGPNWLTLSLEVDGRRLSLEVGEPLEHERILDLRQALVVRRWRHRDASGRITRVVTVRWAPSTDRHVLCQRAWIVPENYGGRMRLTATLDGALAGAMELVAPSRAGALLEGRTRSSGVRIALVQAAALNAARDGALVTQEVERGPATVAERWEWDGAPGQEYAFERVVTLFTSRETLDPVPRAVHHASRVSRAGTTSLVEDHRQGWAERWRDADVEIRGDATIERALRVGLYHLIAAANPEDERVSIGARSLTGPAYRGHVFWDTEIYALPFFVFTWPEAARALLMYRYWTLDAARAKAARLGFRGALYAWESAGTGHEATPSSVASPGGDEAIVTGTLGHHIAADVAYAVGQYWRATGDDEFFARAGAEIALETAAFWASRAAREADGRCHVRGVVGPDEYHDPVDDSAYTNAMAHWNLEFGLQAAQWLHGHDRDRWRELARRLGLSDELEHWRDVAARLVIGHDPRTRRIEQFTGYFGLDDVDLTRFEPRTAAIDALLGRNRTRQTQVIKQADVVLLCHLLRARFDRDTIEASFDYYEPRCDHGSSLSPSIHALVAARLGRGEVARRYLDRAAAIDLEDSMGNAALGFHVGNAGGLWQAVVFGVAGMELRDDGPTFDPHLPPGWASLSFPVRWRGRRLDVTVTPGGWHVT